MGNSPPLRLDRPPTRKDLLVLLLRGTGHPNSRGRERVGWSCEIFVVEVIEKFNVPLNPLLLSHFDSPCVNVLEQTLIDSCTRDV